MSGPWLASYIALWCLVLGIAVILVSTLRNFGLVYSELTKLAPRGGSVTESTSPTRLQVGEPLPDVVVQGEMGERVSIRNLQRANRAFALISPTCSACDGFLDVALKDGPDPMDRSLREFTVISLSASDEGQALPAPIVATSLEIPVLYDPLREVPRTWGVPATPFMVIVDDEMRVIRQVLMGQNFRRSVLTSPSIGTEATSQPAGIAGNGGQS